ncbi:hypothetical protein [Salmonella phage GG32]|uniref:Uncharacterized protein n=3 Tax=Kuttervirus TaxID=2169536 RepID=A0A193GXW5_9CAUD|nr:hypothetical protein BI169_gp009 [Salmonella phage GG32]YP_009883095.1 hypothetical protein HYP88_gp006 [Salmonella phage SS9]AXC40884.1 hypothetical protein [Salmonella phage S117]CAB5508678.1 hypothetical protein [Salmonella phage Se_EM1]CAB5508738.1 hypothetical protein [Salmonella phage Se_EM3]ANN85856.1 hypothetical protein [Salmonella phage GG32]QEI24171.1 hypothetical protein [Salmonella phage SS9]
MVRFRTLANKIKGFINNGLQSIVNSLNGKLFESWPLIAM